MTNSKLKDSNIEWLGKIPRDWKVKPLYLFFFERKNKNNKGKEKNLLSLSYGKIIQKDINSTGGLLPQSYNTYNVIEAGDIIIRPTDLQNDKHSLRTAFSKEHGIITSAYIDLAPLKDTNSEYFHYVLHAYDIEKVFYNMGNGVRQGLNYSEFSKLKLPIPSSEEQKEIVNFLNNQVSQIDKLSKKIQQEITDLEKYRKSIITKAVTKGLNPNVPMKNSNISWIGEVPSNWHIEKLKFIAETRNNKELLSNVQNNYIGLENIVKNTGQYVCSNTTYEEGYYDVCKKGDILYGKLRPNLSKVLVAPFDSCCSGEFLIFKSAKINLKYLFYYLLSQGITEIATSAIYGTKMPRVSWDFIKNLFISFPPKNEDQKEIVNYLDIQCNKIDSILKNKHILLKKLNQYKQSIIYEYVTGKKQVPTEKGAKK